MSRSRIYLDHNASAPLRPVAREAMLHALDATGNPSSGHAEGRAVRSIIETARRQVAALVGADPRGVIFTSGATEAANLVLTPGLQLPAGRSAARLLVGATEHPCVLAGHRFEGSETIPVGPDGVVSLEALEAAVAAGGPVLLALQAAHNETGVLQPVAEAAKLVRDAGGGVVCDAVQAAGRIPCRIADLGVNALILSSHKLGGPKGAGAVVFADSDIHIATPLICGGGQERGLRSGTADVAAIAGFGAACASVAACSEAEVRAVRALRDAFEAGLERLAAVVILGAGAPRLPNTSCFAIPGISASSLLMALDLGGIAVSAGSACSSGRIGRSPVLDAMGVDPHIGSMLRVSFGWSSVMADVEGALAALARTLAARDTGRAA